MQGRSVGSALNRVMLIFAGSAILVALILWYQSTRAVYQHGVERGLLQIMATRTASENLLFTQAENSVKRIHQELSERLENLDPREAEERFYQLAHKDDDGIWRVASDLDDHTRLPSLYIQHDAIISPSLYVRAVASYDLLAERGPAIVPPHYSVYMDFVEKGLMVYSPFVNWGSGATRETDNYNYPTMIGSNPDNNPHREGFWTPVYLDEEAQTWMVSVIEPLDWRGQWVGTVGHDVAIDKLMAQTLVAQPDGSYDMILSADGRLIAHPEFANRINESKADLSLESLDDPKLLRINELITNLEQYPALIEDTEYPFIYTVAKLQGPDWLLVNVYPASLIEQRAFDAVFLPSVALFILALSALFLLRAMMQRLVVEPLRHLDAAVGEMSSGKNDLQIPIQADNEFGRLARSFEDLSKELEFRETSLAVAQQDWQRTFDTVLEHILIMDASYVIKQANQAFYSTFDLKPEDVIGHHRRDLITKANQNHFDSLNQTIIETREPLQFSLFVEGRNLNMEVVVAPLLDGEGEVIGIVEVGRNVTDQNLLEEQLRQSQKMDAVGQLAGGVAHDFNNLLQIILGYAEALEEEQRMSGTDLTSVEQILNAATKAAALTQQLLAFSRRQVMQATNIEVGALLKSTLEMVVRLIESNVQIDYSPPQELYQVEADQNLLEQVVINLCLNARDAMPNGGVLQIGLEHVGAEFIPEVLQDSNVNYVRIWVKDTGSGIALENQERIFEPFFSTKDLNKGTGLGLATAYGIVEQHKGAIKVQSQPGQGAEFSVYLPLTENAEQLAVSTSAADAKKPTGQSILVAEDDEMIRDLVTMMLTRAGYEVISAVDGLNALELYERNESKVDLLLLDVMMPELSGDKVLEKIRQANPSMPCLVASGYNEDGGLIEAMDQLITRFISKPFRREALLNEVGMLLDRQMAGNIDQN